MIAALGATTRVIGNDDKLIWNIPEDLKRFKELTLGHPVIMGRKTWESLPEQFRPLPGRTNIVVTRQDIYPAPGATVAHSLEEAMDVAIRSEGSEEVFVIGGGILYREAYEHASRLYLTLVEDDAPGDTSFPPYYFEFTKEISSESREYNGLKYRFVVLERP